MIIKLYNNKSSNNTINKTIEHIKDIECKLKSKEDLYSIELVLSSPLTDGIDYIYIPTLSRFYFVKSISNKGKMWFVSCECDLLDTYKDTILNSKGYITTQENSYNKYNGDIDFIEETRKDSTIYYSDTTVNLKNTYILTALRGV